MKKIFRFANIGLMLAAIIALGAIAGIAQTDPCTDVDGQGAANDNIQKLFKDTSLAGLKAYLGAGKAFLEKYGACDSAKDLSEYLRPQLPKLEELIKKKQADVDKQALLVRFDTAMKAKNWDDVYASGKEILAKYPDEFRTVEIVLGAVGGDEAFFKGNYKYADESLRFAKQSIADLEAGKPFVVGKDTRYGLSLKNFYNFEYPNKDDAIGWMNLYIGFITNVVKKDKAASLPYLYKATQSASEAKTKASPYGLIGYYYVAEGDKLADDIQALPKPDPKDTVEVAKQKYDAIKAKVALSNGTNERAVDAFARALSRTTDAAYKADIKKALDFSYKRRFEKMDGLDAWIANVQKQPFVNPTTPITPISDPDPVPTTTTNNTPSTVKPPATTPNGKPPAKPGTTAPGKTPGTKGKASIRKPVVKKRAA
jgi:hypothetical protein